MLSTQFFSVSDLQKNYTALLSKIDSSQDPVYILKNNKPAAVMLSFDAYNSLLQSIKEIELQAVKDDIQEFEQAEKDGTLLRLDNVEDLFNS